MAITCTENATSGQLTDGKSGELLYTIKGTDDRAAAITALKAASPTTLGDLIRQPVQVDPLFIDTANPDACLWTGTVSYAPTDYQEPPATGDSSFSFDTGGGTQHITQSLGMIQKYAASGTAPDYKGAIGVTKDSVEGVDVTVPVYTFSETHYIAAADVDDTYKGKLFNLTGRVNLATFRGLAAGECLFLGASGSRRGTGPDDDWEITFRFAGSANATGLSVGSITGIDKKGWEYLWVRYQDEVDETAQAMVKRPVAAYVEKVYKDGNFADLGIG